MAESFEVTPGEGETVEAAQTTVLFELVDHYEGALARVRAERDELAASLAKYRRLTRPLRRVLRRGR